MPTNCIIPRRSTCCIVAGLFLIACLSGCGTSYEVSFQMAANHAATVEARGVQPYVEIANDGPGELRLTWPEATASSLAGGKAGMTVEHGGTVRLETGDQPAAVTVRVRKATGFVLNGPLPKDE